MLPRSVRLLLLAAYYWMGKGLLRDKVLCAHVRGVANIDIRVIGEERDHETKAQAKLCSAHTQFTGWIKWWPT